MSDKEKKELNSFMDDAKGFLSTWQDDYETKNKDILERSKQRKADAQKEHQEMLNLMGEISVEFEGMAKEMYDLLKINVEGFTNAVKEGTATAVEKLELEKRMEQLNDFLVATKNKGAEEFKKIAADIKSKIDNFDTELSSERENLAGDALDNLDKSQNSLKDNFNQKLDDIKNLFSDDK